MIKRYTSVFFLLFCTIIGNAQSFSEVVNVHLELLKKPSEFNKFSIIPLEKNLVMINLSGETQNIEFYNYMVLPNVEQYLSFQLNPFDTCVKTILLQNPDIYSLEVNQVEYVQFWRPNTTDTIFILPQGLRASGEDALINNVFFVDNELSKTKTEYMVYYRAYSSSIPVSEFRTKIENITLRRLAKVLTYNNTLTEDYLAFLMKFLLYEHAFRYHNTLLSYYKNNMPQEIKNELDHYEPLMNTIISTKIQYGNSSFWYFTGRMNSKYASLNQDPTNWQNLYPQIIDSFLISDEEKDYLRCLRLVFTTPKSILNGEVFDILNFSSKDYEQTIVSTLKKYGGLIEGVLLNWRKLLPQDENLNELDTNKSVVLNFWSTSCQPCLQKFARMQEENWSLKGANYNLINICVDSEKSAYTEVVNKFNIQGISIYLGNEEAKKVKYLTSSLPKTILVNPNGIVVKTQFKL